MAALALVACTPLVATQPVPTLVAGLPSLTPTVTPVPPTPTPTRDPTVGYIYGRVWFDTCLTGGQNADPTPACVPDVSGALYGNGLIDVGEVGVAAVTVRLGAGACPSDGVDEVTTDADGNFVFKDVSPGTYCVSVEASENDALSQGGWTYPQVADRRGLAAFSVAAAAGADTRDVNFGWDPTIQPTPTATPTPRESATPSPTVTNTRRPAPLVPTLTFTPSQTSTLTSTVTATPTVTGTITGTPTVTGTATVTATATLTGTATETATVTATSTETPTVTATTP